MYTILKLCIKHYVHLVHKQYKNRCVICYVLQQIKYLHYQFMSDSLTPLVQSVTVAAQTEACKQHCPEAR